MDELTNVEQLNNGIVFVELYTDACNSCKKQAKITEGLIPSYPSINFYQCNSMTEIGAKLCEENNLMQAPSMLIFKDGELVEKFSGLTIPMMMQDKLNRVLALGE